MRWSLVVLVACGGGSPATEDRPVAISPKPTERVLEPITGAHGGVISAIAVTADGKAAVTADTTGGLRLWPTLDGTREPIVLHATAPSTLAIGREGQGFAIAVTDAADHVELVRVDSTGHVRVRQQLGEAKQIEIANDHVLALRADQVIDQIAFDGVLRAQLPAENGTRVESLLVSGTHVAALISSEKQHAVRQIATEAFAWGETSAALDLASDDPGAVLAPDGKSVVATDRSRRIQRFDLASGKPKPACPIGRLARRLDEFGLDSNSESDSAIGIVGDRVACFVNASFTWFDPETEGSQTANVGLGLSPGVMTAAGDRIVVGNEHQLVIVTPDRTEYLGYGFRDLTHVRSVPTGLMIGKGDQEPVMLDDNFRERTRFALPKLRVDWTDLIPVDERYVIASSTRPGSGDLWGSAYQVAIYDSVKQVMHQVLPHRARGGELVYEPATQMLVVTDGTRTLLKRFAPTTHTLGEETVLDLADAPQQIALLDPKLSGGMIALAIRAEASKGIVVYEFHAADMPRATEVEGKRTIAPRTWYRVTGDLKAVDRAGRLYMHNLLHADGIGVYEHGLSKAVLVGAQAARLRASPDGTHVAAIDGGRLVLYTPAGKQLWETAAWGASDIDWTPTGVLFARFPSALARIEPATGRLVERQCGWAFGITTSQRDGSSAAPSVCDVAP